MEVSEALVSLLAQLPNMAGLVILATVLYRQNQRLLDFQERLMANLMDDVEQIRNDLKRVKDKLNVAE